MVLTTDRLLLPEMATGLSVMTMCRAEIKTKYKYCFILGVNFKTLSNLCSSDTDSSVQLPAYMSTQSICQLNFSLYNTVNTDLEFNTDSVQERLQRKEKIPCKTVYLNRQ